MNNSNKNPFEYEGANNLPEDEIIDYYIEDFNYSRFIESTKNIFLIGERGSGKTMTLLYNSFKIKYKKSLRDGTKLSYDKIGIHIPCNTPLFHKKEYLLLNDEVKRIIMCEHILVLSILFAFIDTFVEVKEIEKSIDKDIVDEIYDDLEMIWNTSFTQKKSGLFKTIHKHIERELITTQKIINTLNLDGFYENALSFSSSIIPFINILKLIPKFKNSHFLIMIDDAHDMNEYQIKSLNSWIAYRDHSNFSFKVATAKVNRPIQITSTGGTILEGHDFITVDMEKPFQNEETDFYKLAKMVIERRLQNIGLADISAEGFFPINKAFAIELNKCKDKARIAAEAKYPEGPSSRISEYIYKYHRAIFFRDRSPKANNPVYSGFQSLVDISTGVIRNLLDPCYWMYDKVLNSRKENINIIDSKIQNRSERLWDNLKSGLDGVIQGCTQEQSAQIQNLLQNLMQLFSKRLSLDISEPRAIVFSISKTERYKDEHKEIIELINIARKAQYIYTRMGSSKQKSKQEIYYVPNRLLFPAIGLDPHGQYSRVSIPVIDLWNAAKFNKSLPLNFDESDDSQFQQKMLFDEN